MATTKKDLIVKEIRELIFLLAGAQAPGPDGKPTQLYCGFVNEKHISEGVRRVANKVLKVLRDNYPEKQFKDIYAMTVQKDILPELPEPDFKPDPDQLKQLAEKIQKAAGELDGDAVKIAFDELPDWAIMNKNLDERKQNLSFNYNYLFDKLFLNY